MFFRFYVIDGGGYVIFFQDQTVLISNTLSSHIASLEPNIFLELINKEVFRKVNCSLFESLKVHREYEVRDFSIYLASATNYSNNLS